MPYCIKSVTYSNEVSLSFRLHGLGVSPVHRRSIGAPRSFHLPCGVGDVYFAIAFITDRCCQVTRFFLLPARTLRAPDGRPLGRNIISS